ncbi:endoplasmic reticulum mannosyl-oligosaccharide 1,2-alpha-mannosidase [Halyomorpha halys]|uniref:endoplasmic reticulum mannosyl-oligosaccharide 1,2-alpha-mannosidase n=1 Tax=Halyomorpha halys TaxID=286706 RepID=UPI0006D4FB50|nr:endoplasmic reticulum mannosyl-oligosaccharide 1,2-alpha-mannosidase [Halyomorpha halys]
MREGYVLLTLNPDQQPIVIRRSWWRSWNRLSRLQKNLITTLSFFIIVVIFYKWIWSGGVLLEEEYHIKPYTVALLNSNKVISIAPDKVEKQEIKENVVDIPEQAAQAQVDQPVFFQQMSNNNINEELTDRQKAVVSAFKHAWKGYKKWAWGHDNLRPISKKPSNWFKLGLSIVDSIDTMYIMGLKEELKEAQNWVEHSLKFTEYNDVNLFEVTIRVLGGLLSAFHLTGESVYKDKAKDLGERLLPCFTQSPSPIPYSDVNLASHNAHSPGWGPDSSTSEVTTIQLEFRDLSRITNDPKFEEAASKVSKHVHTLQKLDGLVPIFINPKNGLFQSYSDIKLGARGDSYYEYLVKQWIQTGKTIKYLHDDYVEAIKGVEKHLVNRTSKRKLLFIGELKGGSKDYVPKMDHLVCYLPGTLALGYHHGLPESHMKLALDLLQTCYYTYADRPTFLAPEITYFSLQDDGRGEMYVKNSDAHNLLRPEFVESLWYIYQITGNTTYQDWGWQIFQAFEKYTKVPDGYTSIGNVNDPKDTKPKDMMETFFLSETLKYLFLLFSNNRKLLDIDKYVVNSEGHPVPIYSS